MNSHHGVSATSSRTLRRAAGEGLVQPLEDGQRRRGCRPDAAAMQADDGDRDRSRRPPWPPREPHQACVVARDATPQGSRRPPCCSTRCSTAPCPRDPYRHLRVFTQVLYTRGSERGYATGRAAGTSTPSPSHVGHYYPGTTKPRRNIRLRRPTGLRPHETPARHEELHRRRARRRAPQPFDGGRATGFAGDHDAIEPDVAVGDLELHRQLGHETRAG